MQRWVVCEEFSKHIKVIMMIEACMKPISEDVEGMLDYNFGRAAGSSDKGDSDMRGCMLAPGPWTYVNSFTVESDAR